MSAESKNTMSLEERVDAIQQNIYDINCVANVLYHRPIIKSSWEDYEHYKTLKIPCVDDDSLSKFANVMFMITFEQTSQEGVNRKQYPKAVREDVFLYIVRELRNKNDHSKAGYRPNKITLKEIYNRYLPDKILPKDPQDFKIIQIGVLNDFVDFLIRLKDSISQKNAIEGEIQVDSDGNVHCENVLLPHHFHFLRGIRCSIIVFTNNTLNHLKDKFSFYSNDVRSVGFGKTKEIILSDDGIPMCDKIILPTKYAQYVGCKCKVYKINAQYSKLGGIKCYAIDFSVDVSGESILGKLEYINKRPYVNGFSLHYQAWKNLTGDFVLQVTRIKCFYNGEDPIEFVDAYIYEGKVVKSRFGLYHCGNIAIEEEIGKKYLNQIVHPQNISNNPKKNQYFYYSDTVELADSTTDEKPNTSTTKKEVKGNSSPDETVQNVKNERNDKKNGNEKSDSTRKTSWNPNQSTYFTPVYVPYDINHPIESAMKQFLGNTIGQILRLKFGKK